MLYSAKCGIQNIVALKKSPFMFQLAKAIFRRKKLHHIFLTFQNMFLDIHAVIVT